MASNRAIYPGGCEGAKLLHEHDYGPPPPGKQVRCFPFVILELTTVFSLVYWVSVPATYLVQTVHERTGVAPITDDVEVTTTHWRWDGSGDPGDTDFLIVEARLDGFWSTIANLRSDSVTVREHRWYPAVLPPDTPGEALRVIASGIEGTATGNLHPPQVATTLTFITDVRRRWGRFYIGGLTTVGADFAGRQTSAAIISIVEAAESAFLNTATNWKVQVFGSPTPNSLPVRSVRVDDVFDIIRSRRYGGTLIRETRSLDP